MSQAAYYNGYDDGFLDGRRAEARKAPPDGSGGSSGPLVVVVKPSTALVKGALNYVAPTRSFRYDWTARLDEYYGQVVPMAGLPDAWRPAGAPRLDEMLGWIVDVVEPDAAPYGNGTSYGGNAPTDGYTKVDGLVASSTVSVENVEYTDQNSIVIGATCTAEVFGVTKTWPIFDVVYNKRDDILEGM